MWNEQPILSLGFLKKQVFTGSYRGMRYLLKKEEEEGETKLVAVTWPQPYSYATSPVESQISANFPFSEEGRREAIAWLEKQYEAKKEIWTRAGF